MAFDSSLIGYTPNPDDPFPRPRPFPWPWPPYPPRPWPYQMTELLATPILIAAVQADLGARMKDKLGTALSSAASAFIDECGTGAKPHPHGPGPSSWFAVSLLETAAALPEGVARRELQRAAGLLMGAR